MILLSHTNQTRVGSDTQRTLKGSGFSVHPRRQHRESRKALPAPAQVAGLLLPPPASSSLPSLTWCWPIACRLIACCPKHDTSSFPCARVWAVTPFARRLL